MPVWLRLRAIARRRPEPSGVLARPRHFAGSQAVSPRLVDTLLLDVESGGIRGRLVLARLPRSLSGAEDAGGILERKAPTKSRARRSESGLASGEGAETLQAGIIFAAEGGRHGYAEAIPSTRRVHRAAKLLEVIGVPSRRAVRSGPAAAKEHK